MNITFENNSHNFVEYRFPLNIFSFYIESAGFQILEISPAFFEDGLYHDLGGLVGSWDFKKGKFEKIYLGRFCINYFQNYFHI